MRALQRTLIVVAALFLLTQTVRHAYVMWMEPRVSALDRFDEPLKEEIAAAVSIEELLQRYEPVRAEADRIKAERRAANPEANTERDRDVEPFRSESALRIAIQSWESRAEDILALRFYWIVGLLLVGAGMTVYRRGGRWTGVTLLIVGFLEMVYWTCPTFLGTATREFDRLLLHKLVLSAVSAVLLAIVTRLLGSFREDGDSAT